KLAYLILAHKDYEQVTLLIEQLIDEDTHVFVHVDKKNNKLYEELESGNKSKNNVHILSDRVSVNWSGFSQVDATLKLLTSAMLSDFKFEYVSLLSGQCLPIKSNEYIKSFLSEYKGFEFLEYKDITTNKKYSYRLKIYNFFRENKNIRKIHMRLLD